MFKGRTEHFATLADVVAQFSSTLKNPYQASKALHVAAIGDYLERLSFVCRMLFVTALAG